MKTFDLNEFLESKEDKNCIIGNLGVQRQMMNMLLFSKMYKKEMKKRNIAHPQGVLLYGVPGVGKSILAKNCSLKYQSKFPNVNIRIWEPKDYMAGRVGRSSAFISEQFDYMREKITQGMQFILIVNEIELLVPKSSGRSLEKERAIAMLNEITGMSDDILRGNLFLIGTTNNPSAINPAFYRSLRIQAVYVDLPSYEDRLEFAERLLTDLDILGIINKENIADLTEKWTGADFEYLKYEIFVLMKEKEDERKKIDEDDIQQLLLDGHGISSTNKSLIEIAKFDEMYKKMQRGLPYRNGKVAKNMNFDLPYNI